jgi:HEAT repeat protein/ATP/ADP translocase
LKLNKALNILDSDVRPIVLLGALHFVVAAAHALFDIGSTSLLIANLGADVLPEVYIGSALLLISVGFFFIPMVDRLDRVRLFTITLAFFALVLAITHHLGERAPDLIYRGLYLLCYLMKGLVFLQYWLIAGEVADLRQAKRIFPILLGFSLTGGLAASLAASVLPRWIPTEDLLFVAAILLAAGLIPTRVVARRYRERLQHPGLPVPFHVSDIWTQVRSDLKISLSSRLLRNLSLSTLLFALLAQFMDFFMGKAASLHYVDATGIVETGALTAFYAALNASVIGVGAVLQFLVANRLISSVGVTRGQITGSLAFLAGFGAIAVSLIVTGNGLGLAFFYAVLASRALQKVLRISIYRSSIDLIYNPIPSERRGRAKAFKETVIEPVGVLLGGLLLIIGGLFDAKVLVLAALALSSRFRFAFPSSVVRPAQRKKEPEGVVSDLERALDDNAVSVRLLAVELAAELREPAAAPLLVRHFSQEPDPKVRATMVAALGKLLRRKQESLSAVEPSLEDQDARVRANGIDALAQIGITESSSFLAPFVHDPEPRIRANTAVAYTRLDPERGADEARQILLDMYESGEESPQLSALFGLGEVGDEKSVEVLGSAMNDDRISVRHRAILGLAQAGRREGIDKLLVFLEEGDGATRHVAARALESCGEAAIDPLILALWGSEVGVRQYVSRALGHIGAPRARQALIHILSLEAEGAYYDLLRLEKIGELPQTSGIVLLADSLTERVRQAKANALQVLQLAFGDQKGMRLILSNLIHPEPYVRSSAIEALEVRVDQSLLGGVQPLFEHSNPRVTAEHGGVLYQLPSKEPLEVLMELASDRSRWIRACAIYAMGEAADKKVLPLLERRIKDPYELARLNAIEAIGRLAETSSLALLEQIRKEQEGRVRQYADLAIREIQARSGSSAG